MENKSFTLIELLIVVVIIGILTGLAIPAYQDMKSRARAIEAKTNLKAIDALITDYFIQTGTFPPLGPPPSYSIPAVLNYQVPANSQFGYHYTRVPPPHVLTTAYILADRPNAFGGAPPADYERYEIYYHKDMPNLGDTAGESMGNGWYRYYHSVITKSGMATKSSYSW